MDPMGMAILFDLHTVVNTVDPFEDFSPWAPSIGDRSLACPVGLATKYSTALED